jgi:hypothetical protein
MDGMKRKYRPVLTKEERTKINATNRNRARAMEIRIARYLRGKRTPMSGAGSIKGDVLVHTDRGLCVVSCKLSAALTRTSEPYINLRFSWFDELYKDKAALTSLGARFGILVIHWHGFRDDLVFIPIQYLAAITTKPLLHLPGYELKAGVQSYRLQREIAVNHVFHIWKMGDTSAVLLPIAYVKSLLDDNQPD